MFTVISNDGLDGNESCRSNVEAHSHKSLGCLRTDTNTVWSKLVPSQPNNLRQTWRRVALDRDGCTSENVRNLVNDT